MVGTVNQCDLAVILGCHVKIDAMSGFDRAVGTSVNQQNHRLSLSDCSDRTGLSQIDSRPTSRVVKGLVDLLLGGVSPRARQSIPH